ncbi:MAG: Panacea domain-containing protein [Alphaproteobacteria bacterium]|nr:Panacea domain-containing protein [Alphaproteobacteria bacterium]
MEEKIVFLPNYHRIIDIVCLLAQKSGAPLGVHQAMKLLFFADVEHMNKHYVPMTGGRYLAMRFGPVHKEAYDLINGNRLNLLDVDKLPFNRKDKEIVVEEKRNNYRYMTPEHIAILDNIWTTYGKKDFAELTDISHQHPAWQKAWGERINDAPEMSYEYFLPKALNKEIISDLRESSRFITL